jgi:hypothetical protein
MSYFAILIGIALVLTFISLKVRMILFRVGTFLAWLACGIYLLIGQNSILDISNVWNQVLGLLFIVMAFAVLALQIVVETKKTGPDGSSYTEWGRPKKGKRPSRSQLAQDAHRETIRRATGKR